MDRAQERRLIRRAAAGDKQAAEACIRAHQQSLYAYMLRLSGRPDVAEDIVQEAFVRVLTSLDRFDDRYRFSTWLFTIARRLYVNACQKHKPVYESDVVGGWHSSADGPESPVIDAEVHGNTRDALQAALLRLPDDQREVVILFHQQDWPIALIASIWECPRGRSRATCRGRRRLRALPSLGTRCRSGRGGMALTEDRPQPDRRSHDEWVDELLDRRADDPEARAMFDRLRTDLDACRELASLKRAADALRRSPSAPDLTADILRGVDRRRRFLPSRLRRMVTLGRVAVAAGVVFAIGVTSLARRHVPELAFTPEPTHLSTLVSSGTAEARQCAKTMVAAVGTIRDDLTAPVTQVVIVQARTGDQPQRTMLYRSSSVAFDVNREPLTLSWQTTAPVSGGSGAADLPGGWEYSTTGSSLHAARPIYAGRRVSSMPLHAGLFFDFWHDPAPALPERFERASRDFR
ncbi:MAG: sigma-70 family RNA polymerase sigma factor [Phycisphaeraceae bacterium]|nr:sigma-70 family RNA polymerase sigma factor [Phycisphaeraceae bacterium]